MWTSESPRSAPPRDHESGPFPADPRDTKERKDYLLLARHMSNFTEADVAKVYGWLREGGDRRRPMKWPGGFARRNHALPTSEDDCSQWQGYFRRFFQQGQKRSALPHVREERARGSRAA